MKKLKIGLFGFGRTGKAVAAVLLSNDDFSLEWVYRQKKKLENRSVSEFLGIESDDPGLVYSNESIDFIQLINQHPVDCIIDFSSDTGIYSYGSEAAKRGIKIVSAISHYDDEHIAFMQDLALSTTVFWSPNITIGINFLLYASKNLKKIAPFADIEIIEEHFKDKTGISGTALRIAESLDVEKSNINSIRAGGIVGKHEIIFGFPYQTVRLVHESISREAFGNGIVFVISNIKYKSTGYYVFEDLLMPYFIN